MVEEVKLNNEKNKKNYNYKEMYLITRSYVFGIITTTLTIGVIDYFKDINSIDYIIGFLMFIFAFILIKKEGFK